MNHPDIVIVGGGMAGASLGAQLAAHASVLILEMEDSAGYHATGRSVAFWEETYGGPLVQPLTTASGPYLTNPDPDFHDRSFLSPRRALHVGRAEDAPWRDALMDGFAGKVDLRAVDPASLMPGLRPDWTIGVLEESCQDIDVAALHQAHLRRFRRLGGEIRLATRLNAARSEGGGWQVDSGAEIIHCGLLVNAAGAWADQVATACGVRPIGITPLRRTVVQLHIPGLSSPDLPRLMDLRSRFYFKPEGRDRVWLTPHDEVPSPPCDAAPEELAVAQAIALFQQAVDWPIAAVEHKWAGLRSFAPDRAPVYGFDPDSPGFFWFAGQGGFGIQTSPAAALLGAALITGNAPPAAIAKLDSRPYSPTRFR
ncbi:NAD(P)/FAD-dependent oxidoreductase [Sphingobium limneticum]|uniref:FAD-binding oxidoreductase n=1 Tax=Sphingobium limneticum TaxID=1007511 RepID=A0A5J5IAA1_9SPHN|nr:FAD-binding oxidoreductase [Sphingobium limneticum]KAA9020857.1 FAD-binding oxidoreductase [Sphingobium limneticum]KAA9033184.1 FAD-binding oxidoreductase [Sphingobium limneticum]